GVPLPTSSGGLVDSPTDDDFDISKTTSSTDSRENDIRAEIMRNVAAIPMLKYEELKEATGNWSASNLLGQGGFAQVFKGEWKQLTVAVKRLRATDARDRELIRELCLNQYRHDNIVPLYGYSCGGAEVCLVYQLMAGGSLEVRLRGRNNIAPLSWPQRHKIAHGVARGLQFLHTMTSTPLIHGDIKPANILLDQCLIPKIGDFGLARKGPYGDNRTHFKVSRVHGTRPYLPDEYLRSGCLSPAVDVFSFGVVLLELATSLRPADASRPIQKLADFMRVQKEQRQDTAQYEDRVLYGTPHSNPQLCREFINMGIHCTSYQRNERPKMLEVYKRLDSMMHPPKAT
ncbi:serine/threonine-protein kinase pelle, partial [Ostrinia furnacalis]